MSRAVVGGVLSISAVVALAGGVAGIGAGERSFHPHEEECAQREEGSLTVSDKASVAATITFDGRPSTRTRSSIGRNTVQTMIFKNLSDELTKFVVQAGEREALDSAGQALTGAGRRGHHGAGRVLHRPRPARHPAGADRQLPRARLLPVIEAQDEEGTVHAEGTVMVP